MKKNIDPIFKNKLDSPQKAPDGAWDYIQSQLPPEDDTKPLLPFWKKYLGIAILAAVLVGTGLVIIGNKSLFTQEPVNQITHDSMEQLNTDFEGKKVQQNQMNFKTEGKISNAPTQQNERQTATDVNQQYGNDGAYKISNVDKYQSTKGNVSQNNHQGVNTPNEQNDLFSTVLTQNYAQTKAIKKPWSPELIFIESSALLKEIYIQNENLIASTIPDSKSEKQKERKNKFKMDFDKFYLSGFVSPTGLNTFVGSSMLSDNLNEYKTENNITLSYGLKAAYAIHPKVKIRTGLSVIGFEQITKNVLLSTGFSETADSFTSANDNIIYSGNLRIHNPNETNDLSYRISDGDVQQQSQFIEIPLEAEISVFQSGSIGISATGGGSTWLLSKNKIYAHTNGHTEELGKADNLNKTSFSANAGLKFDMKISENVQLNVEPNFKYLLNPVRNIENYSPYTIGVNAGVTVKIK